MEHYVVTVEFDERIEVDRAEQLVDELVDFHPAAGASQAGMLQVTLTLPAEGLRQAVAQALALTGHLGRLLGVSALPERVRDGREGWATVPDLLSVTEAAGELGVTRQRVLQMIGEGKLPNSRVGREYAIPRSGVEALAGR